MTNRLELNWKLDGFVDEQRYYCSETPIDPENLPLPKAVLAGEARSHTDTNIEIGKTYYIRVGSVRNGVEKISEEKSATVGIQWTPSALTTAMYFSADSVIKDGSNRISQLTDLSGNNRHATQSVDVYKPVLSTFNDGSLAMQFDGTDDLLWQSNTSYLDGVSGAWIFSVNDLAAKSGYNYIAISFYTGTGSTKIGQDINESKYHLGSRRTRGESYAGLDDSATRSNTQNIVFTQVDYANADGFLYVNGTQTASNTSHGTSGNADSIALIGTTIGAYAGNEAGSSYEGGINGKLGCVVIGAGVLSSSDREKLEGWAAHKYGLQSNLPVDHPYKNTPPFSS